MLIGRSNDAYSFTGHAALNRLDTHEGLNQIVATGALSAVHDGRGNAIAIGAQAFTYTSENRMASAGTLETPPIAMYIAVMRA